jgi:hypothetical protein
VGQWNESGSAATPSIANISDALFVIGGGVSDAGRKNILVVNYANGIYLDAASLPTSEPTETNRIWREEDPSDPGTYFLKIK